MSQFTRLAEVIHKASVRAMAAYGFHDKAAQKIDAALYECQQLRRELEPYLTKPLPEREKK